MTAAGSATSAALDRFGERLGVDYRQWLALTLVALKLDVAQARTRGGATAGPFAAGFAFQLVIYSTFGLFIGILVWLTRDVRTIGTLAATYTMAMVGLTVLLDHNAIVSPDDYIILAHQPVTSRTYFMVRLANALVYTAAIALAVAWLPVASLLIRYGLAVAVAAAAACFAASAMTVLVIVLGYTWVLRAAGAVRVKRLLSYLQLALSFVVYGGFVLGGRQFSGSMARSIELPRSGWVLLFPPTWFASYLEIARGQIGAATLAPAAASVASLGLLAWGLGSRLTLDHSHQLAETIASSERAPGGALRSRGGPLVRLFPAGEARAVALLVRSQFQNDLKFRLGVLAIVPMTVFYLWYGLTIGTLRDPFLRPTQGQSFPLLLVALVTFPAALRTHVTRSDAFRASWIFFTTPGDRMQVIRAVKNVLAVGFLAPYLAFVTVALIYLTGAVVHVAIHLALVGLLSHLALQVVVLIDPELPFSRPLVKGQNTAHFLGYFMAAMFTATLFEMFSWVLYRSAIATAGAFAVVIGASAAVDRLTRLRVERETARLEFVG